ncbi:MAG: nicotinate-nucleotide--dimethylbenzimidazole phosphoribosyltransferase, partial [Candidatus Rokuibacteriota bacterium]
MVAPDPRLALAAQRRLDGLTKPPGSLGRLEDLAVRVVVLTGEEMPRLDAPVIFTLAADHGV